MKYLLSKPDVGDLEEQFVLDALRSGWVAPLGPHVADFEQEMAEYLNVDSAVALASGTAALHLGLLGMGCEPMHTVIVPTMTFAATANAVSYTGAEPFFVDSRASDGNVDVDLVEDAIKECRVRGKTVSALIAVDLFGSPANYRELRTIADEFEVPLLEDAAEALGSTYEGQPAGGFGRAAALSFNGNKIMTTSGGGMLVSNDTALVQRARKLATQSREPVPWYEHTEIGYNYRMSNVLAALGRAQLRRLPEFVARRRAIRQLYQRHLMSVPGVRFLENEGETNAWLTCIVIDSPNDRLDINDVVKRLHAHGIEARHLWKPLHMQPAFKSSGGIINGVAQDLFARGLALPSGFGLTDNDIESISSYVAQELGNSR